MKKLIKTYSNLYTFILTILLFGSALFISVFINKETIKEYFPYTAVILLAITTWFLYRREGYTLDKIGLNFKVKVCNSTIKI